MPELNWRVSLNRRVNPAMWQAVAIDKDGSILLDHNNDPKYRRFFFTRRDAEWFVGTLEADMWVRDLIEKFGE